MAATDNKPLDGAGLSVVTGIIKNWLGLKADISAVPTNTSDLNNDSGFISTETDPTVPAWAKAATKPTYTASEVGAISLTQADSFAKKSDIVGVYIYKGSVATYSALPTTDQVAGDVYNVEDTDMNYGWTGTKWDPLGSMFQLNPLTSEEIAAIMNG